MRVSKQRCDNCPARNRTVREIIFNKNGKRMALCAECRAILDKLDKLDKQAAKQ